MEHHQPSLFDAADDATAAEVRQGRKREALGNLVKKIGEANKASGAAARTDVDRTNYGGRAAEIADRRADTAERIAKAACQNCAIADLCEYFANPETLIEQLAAKSAGRRQTFLRRVNNGLSATKTCDDILRTPGQMRKN
jgi:hypothetical protein